MKTFQFKMFISTNGQEFNVGGCNIDAPNYDSARKIFDSKDLPFHTFSTVECIKGKVVKGKKIN